jgi:hypothetical protein
MRARYTKLMILLYVRTHGMAQNVAVVMLQKLLGITDSLFTLFHYISACACFVDQYTREHVGSLGQSRAAQPLAHLRLRGEHIEWRHLVTWRLY